MIEQSAGAPNERAQAHVRSGQVMTVRGPVPLGALGRTLMHEHLLLDSRLARGRAGAARTGTRRFYCRKPLRVYCLTGVRPVCRRLVKQGFGTLP